MYVGTRWPGTGQESMAWTGCSGKSWPGPVAKFIHLLLFTFLRAQGLNILLARNVHEEFGPGWLFWEIFGPAATFTHLLLLTFLERMGLNISILSLKYILCFQYDVINFFNVISWIYTIQPFQTQLLVLKTPKFNFIFQLLM